MNKTEHERREQLLFAVLLLFGIAILLCVGQAAIGIAPNWEVAANMRSNLDANKDFLTRRNSGIVEPLNSDILTLPAWLDILFTPNATLPTNAGITPPATRAPTRASTQAPTQPATLPPTSVSTFPVTPPTKKPPLPVSTSTPTNIPSIPSANLAITKTDTSPIYIPGSGISYQIVVTNGGPNNASGFGVKDTVPAGISILPGGVGCSTIGTASCGTDSTISNNVSFTGMSVNVGASITITIAGTVNAGMMGNLVNTASIVILGGAGFSDPDTANNTYTDTDTPFTSADLVVTKTDGKAAYVPGDVISYQIVVTNGGPNNASGFSVTDTVPAVINGLSVGCTTSGTASCGTNGTSGYDVSFTGMSVNVGASITITINGTVDAGATENLVNIADIVIPGGAGFSDPNTGNNTYTDTDTLITIDPLPATIGTSPDNMTYDMPIGNILTLDTFPIVVNGHVNPDGTLWDFIYYEFLHDGGIYLDWVIIEISDGNNWYTVFNWFNNDRDMNTNVDFNFLPPPPDPSDPNQEPDERIIPGAYLYVSTNGYATGVAIDLDSVVPPGIYPYMRFYAPTRAGETDGHLEIDAIEVLP